MKKYYVEDTVVYVGKAEQVKALYKSLRRGGVYFPLYVDFPKLVTGRLYGLAIDPDGSFTVMSGETLGELYFDERLVKAA